MDHTTRHDSAPYTDAAATTHTHDNTITQQDTPSRHSETAPPYRDRPRHPHYYIGDPNYPQEPPTGPHVPECAQPDLPPAYTETLAQNRPVPTYSNYSDYPAQLHLVPTQDDLENGYTRRMLLEDSLQNETHDPWTARLCVGLWVWVVTVLLFLLAIWCAI